MVPNIRKILTIFFIVAPGITNAQEIWAEHFDIPNKGVWANYNGELQSDFEGVSSWTLKYENVQLADSNDYAKTVKTAGGRFECKDINGEVSWISETIDISNYQQINIQLTAYETGSGANLNTKFLKAFYNLDNSSEILFNTNGINSGNWGKTTVEQKGLSGKSLRIIIKINNAYSNDKVTLDDVIVTGDTNDNSPPFITSAIVISPTQIKVFFNESLREISADNFAITNKSGINIPVLSAIKSDSTKNVVLLEIQAGKTVDLILSANNISDLNGNILTLENYKFEYLPPHKKFDLVINELMIDPNPPNNLPGAEYIEIFNRQSFPISVENWSLKINSASKNLNKFIVNGGAYFLLCSTTDTAVLKPFAPVLGVSGFQGLRNSGAEIVLSDKQQNIIDALKYTPNWYLPENKNKGGWSLERIDPDRFCNPQQNWIYSNNIDGGTPGTINSVFASNLDTITPKIVWATAENQNQVEIRFAENMDTVLLKNPQNFLVDKNVNPSEIKILQRNTVLLSFNFEFELNRDYQLEIFNLSDECGNLLLNDKTEFQWNEIEANDVVINEILFNPFAGGNDFVELYNRSEKKIMINRLKLASRNDSLQLAQIYSLSDEKRAFAPHSYLALTADTTGVFNFYALAKKSCFLQMPKFPSFNNDNDYVVLLNNNLVLIDEFYYTKKMHSSQLFNTEGVSLERVNFDTPTVENSNWHSASGSSGYATPGYQNSQYLNETTEQILVSFEPESFSPNYDNYNDVYSIHIEPGQPGYLCNIRIFDPAGRQVRCLANSIILGTTETLKWDGTDDTNRKLPLGVYIVWVEIFNSSGVIKHYKDGVVVTDMLD